MNPRNQGDQNGHGGMGGLDAEQFAREHPALAQEIASIPIPPVRIYIPRGRWLIPAWSMVAGFVFSVAFELAVTWFFADRIQVHHWSPWWWLVVGLFTVIALWDAWCVVDLSEHVHRARHGRFPKGQ